MEVDEMHRVTLAGQPG